MRPEKWLYILPLRLRSLLRRERVDQDLEDELRYHLERKTEENIARGLTPTEARRQALLELRGIEQTKEACRDARHVSWLQDLAQDLRYGLRMLRKSPGFTTVAVLTLALGIGGNVAVFSLINQTLLRLLPVQDPGRLVLLRSTGMKNGTTEDADTAVVFSYPMYTDLRDKNPVFSGLLACFPYTSVNVAWRGHSERRNAALVSGNFFAVLGVRPALGRVFSQQDETAPAANPVVILSYDYWRRHFGADPAVLNRTVGVDANPMTVVGVAQPGFSGVQLGMAPDLYIPITMRPQLGSGPLGNVNDYFLELLGRLKPGVSAAQAQIALQPAFHAILESELPAVIAANMITADQSKQFLGGKLLLTSGAQGRALLQQFAKTPLTLVMAMVGLVLLIACANLASLLLVRGEARQHEVAVRLTIGARPTRLIRQLLTETLIVAFAGGIAGLLLGWWTLRLFLSSVPASLGLFVSGITSSLDLRVLAFSAAVTLISALLAGLVPAVRTAHADLQFSLKEEGPGSSGGPRSVLLRKVLVVAQVASTVAILIAAGLLGESLVRLERTNLGMSITRLLQFSIDPGLSHYSPAQTAQLFKDLRRDIAGLPGVASASVAEVPLLTGSGTSDTMKFQDYTGAEDTTVYVNFVGPQFFSTMGIPLLQGREFRDGDSASSARVAIVNEIVASEFFARRNAVGMHLAIGWGPSVQTNVEIVGVVANAKSVDARDPGRPFVYFPYLQDSGVSSGTFYVLAHTDPSAVAPAVLRVVQRDARNLPVYDVRTLSQQFNDSMMFDRLLTLFTMSLAILAALLAVVGLYGVMAYGVVRRRREFAIRIALGATRADVVAPVLREGVQLMLLGVALGLAGAFGLTKFLASLLFGVGPRDPLVFATVPILLTGVALLACYVPARRAMHVDPMVALRHE